ncbi:hypothetical protein [Pseudomonas frederiksbergensis]|uniref:Uncharacterized protein n=1 Tax=Pseudomonas frederiksbergensis TaxID=104087 RepID=A0A6L5BLP7_9PSED|nr:hypothetical protein [Pseudomonas frederiksbergensis]KAF2389621.1 hypothetical protein FX983_04060 [Pseudomonas frederiksbergensis]
MSELKKLAHPATEPERPLLSGIVTADLYGSLNLEATFKSQRIDGNYGHYKESIYVNAFSHIDGVDHILFFIPTNLTIGRHEIAGTDFVVSDTRFGYWKPEAGFLFLESIVPGDYHGQFELYREVPVGGPDDPSRLVRIVNGKFHFEFAP